MLAVGRDVDRLAAAQGRFPHALRALAADLATPAGVDAVAAAARDFGGVDCVVQAAGLNRFGLVEQQDDEAIAAQVALNLVAPMLLTRRLLPLLRERPRALLLFVGSTFGAIGYPGFAPYSATKFGLRGFAEALRRELADGPVRVLYLAPRATRTAMNASAVVEMNRALGVAMDPPAAGRGRDRAGPARRVARASSRLAGALLRPPQPAAAGRGGSCPARTAGHHPAFRPFRTGGKPPMNMRDHKPFATATLRLARRVALPLAFPLLSLLAAPAAFALADTGKAELQAVQGRWADIHYGLPEKQREAAFAELAERAARAVAVEPEAAELRIWHAIVLSTWAGAKGGLGALGLVKEAKAELETALRLDPRALDGSAYTSLGSLYYQVPGWPLGFGDDAQAEAAEAGLGDQPRRHRSQLLLRRLPSRQKRYAEARTALEKALAAPDRPGRGAPTPAGARRRAACSSRWSRSWRKARSKGPICGSTQRP